MGKPVIGITTYLTRATWGAWDMEAALVPSDYVRAVERSGGTPLLVPPGADAEATLAVVDGLIFTGGSDLDPELYGETAHPQTNGIVRERDDFELGCRVELGVAERLHAECHPGNVLQQPMQLGLGHRGDEGDPLDIVARLDERPPGL